MESDFVRWLRARLPSRPWLGMGPGDDAAVLWMGKAGEEVATCDLLADGVHFRTGRDSARRIGHKALAVNLSDIAAMAARPRAAICAVLLPRDRPEELARELIEGMLPLVERYDVSIAGGDTNTWDGPLVISITLLGEAGPKGPLLRSGARPDDWLLVTGQFGGSILGRHLDFEPRVNEAMDLIEHYPLHAGIDASDGLALDASRLGEESGCGVVLDLDQIPVSDAARQCAASSDDDKTALDHALSDGEDFELILAVPPDEAEKMLAQQPLDIPLTRIGTFVSEPGLWRVEGTSRVPLAPRGYEHRSTP